MAYRTLDVPLHRRPKDSRRSGAYCAKMVLHFFGKRVSLERILRELDDDDDISLASWLVTQGMTVTLVTGRRDVPTLFLEGSRGGPSPRAFSTFVEGGGTFALRPASTSDVYLSVANGIPPIVRVNASRLPRGPERSEPHRIVVVGTGPGTVTANDPRAGRCGGRRTYGIDRLERAFFPRGRSSMIVAFPRR